MDKDEALELLNRGERGVFNSYRENNPHWSPDFSGEDLSGCDLVGSEGPGANLDHANLCGASLPGKPNITYKGFSASFNEATIDSTTSGVSLDLLSQLGAIYITKSETKTIDQASTKNVFISYAWANSDVVSAIDQWLRNKGLKTRIDKRDFFAGSRIRDEISRVMLDSDVVLVFHSHQSKDKPWVEFERELVADIQMSAKKEGKDITRVIYVVIDDTPLPSVSEQNRIAITAKGKRFELVCEEIYHHILKLPRTIDEIDLAKWDDYVF